MVVLFVLFAVVALTFGLVEHFRPGAGSRRSAERANPFWLDDGTSGWSGTDGSGAGDGGGFGGDGGGCGGGDGGGGGGC